MAPMAMARSKVCSNGMFQSHHRLAPPARQSVVVRSTGWADPAATNAEKAMFGSDFGARDPFAAEIESNFSDKVLGHYNTDHIIKIPAKLGNLIGLAAKQCVPADQAVLLPEKELNLLAQQVPGWKVITNKAGKQALRYEWRLRNPDSALQLQAQLSEVCQGLGHAPEVTVSGDILVAELTSLPAGGLTENDMIVASRINALDVKDLLPPPRKRYWA